jgi:hypothetical protein
MPRWLYVLPRIIGGYVDDPDNCSAGFSPYQIGIEDGSGIPYIVCYRNYAVECGDNSTPIQAKLTYIAAKNDCESRGGIASAINGTCPKP